MKKIKANELISYLSLLFPNKKAAEWDKVGFQIQEVYNIPEQDEYKNIIVCLDVTKEVVEEAIKTNSNLIISRHPFIFEELNLEFINPAKKKLYSILVENKIQVYSIHTNYDNSNKQLLLKILENHFEIKNIKRIGDDDCGIEVDLMFGITMTELLENIKKVFSVKKIKFTENTKLDEEISNFVVLTGSGASLMYDSSFKSKVLITGEAKWSDIITASENNISLILTGHYSENYFIKDIKKLLEKHFKNQLSIIAFDIGSKLKNI